MPKSVNDINDVGNNQSLSTFDNVQFNGLTITTGATFAGATIANLGSVTTADINGGTIDGVAIGSSSPSTGKFTTITMSSSDGTITSTGSSTTLSGGNSASDTLVLTSTTHGTKGNISIPETTDSTSVSTGSIVVGGGIGIAKEVWANGYHVKDGTMVINATGGHGLIQGETGASGQLILRSTSNGTKGQIVLDETTDSINAGTGTLFSAGGAYFTKNIQSGAILGAQRLLMGTNFSTDIGDYNKKVFISGGITATGSEFEIGMLGIEGAVDNANSGLPVTYVYVRPTTVSCNTNPTTVDTMYLKGCQSFSLTGGAVVDTASVLHISNAPLDAATNYAIWVEDGTSKFVGINAQSVTTTEGVSSQGIFVGSIEGGWVGYPSAIALDKTVSATLGDNSASYITHYGTMDNGTSLKDTYLMDIFGSTTVQSNCTYTSSLSLREPQITKSGGVTIGTASTLMIHNAPTEGSANYGFYVVSGDSYIQKLSVDHLITRTPKTYCGYMSTSFTHNSVSASAVLFVDSGVSGANWTDTNAGSFTSDSPATFRIKYTGVETRMFHVTLTTSTSGSAGGNEYHLTIGKNNSAITGADIQRTLGASSAVGSITCQVCVSLSTNDIIDSMHWVSAGTPNITVEHAQITIMPTI